MIGPALCLWPAPSCLAPTPRARRRRRVRAAAPAQHCTRLGLLLASLCALLLIAPTRLRAQPVGTPQPDLLVNNSEIGIGFLRPGCWGLAKALATNPSDQPAEFTVELLLGNSQGIQYRRPLWLPAHSQRSTWLPLPIPAGVENADKGLDISGLLLTADGSGERVLARHRYLLMGSIRPYQLRLLPGEEFDDPACDMADVVGMGVGPHRRTQGIEESHLPPVAQGYEGLDGLFLAKPHPVLDAAQFEALRLWLWTGGHLWVALDRVDPAFMTRLLGTQWQTAVVGHVALTHFRIEAVDPGATGEHNQPDYPRDQPVDMVRVLPGNLEVTHTCQGWPAALRGTIGRGRLLVTTIAARGWFDTQEQPAPPLNNLAAMFRSPASAPIETRDWSAFAANHLGYRVPTRPVIAGLLGGFCLALLAAGVLLRRAGRLEQIGAIAAALSLLTVAILLTVGLTQRYRTPPSAASAALVETFAGQAMILERGVIGVYSPGGEAADLPVTGAGTLTPEAAPQAARPAQLVWQDLDRYVWRDVDFPSGSVRSLGFSLVRPLPQPIAVHARFGPHGLTGAVAGAGADLADGLILGPNGHLAAREPAAFTADTADSLPDDQFVIASTGLGVLSSEQALRQDVYRLYAHKTLKPTPLTLCGWTAGFDPGFGPPDVVRRLSTCLLTMPITLDHSEPGTTVHVPSACIGFRVERAPAATAGPAAHPSLDFQVYSADTAQWHDLHNAEDFVLRFRLPDGVVPLQLTSAQLTLDLVAPSRTVTIEVLDGSTPRTVATADSPKGVLAAQLVEASAPIPAGGADVVVLVHVGSAPDEQSQLPPTWYIRRAALTVQGVAQ